MLMKRVIVALVFFLLGSKSQALDLAPDELRTRCGIDTVADMIASGWQFDSKGYISTVTNSVIELEDGSSYEADMTVGILIGDHALIFRKYVRREKVKGFIYNLCAGGFDAWVNLTPGASPSANG